MTIADIANAIKEKADHVPVIIAIDGFGGAGKSTLAAKLKTELGDAYIVEIDDFFLKDAPSDGFKSNFDRKRLAEQVLKPVRDGQPAAYQKLLWDTNTLSDFVKVPPVKYLIIEGVSSFHPDIANYMDYKIWVDAPSQVARQRMVTRDLALGNNHGELWDHWTVTYQDYVDLHHPQEKADFVFDTEAD